MASKMTRPDYPVNVKIPQKYVEIIDKNLIEGKPLSKIGFKGRAHFVRTVVAEKLISLGLLPENERVDVKICH